MAAINKTEDPKKLSQNQQDWLRLEMLFSQVVTQGTTSEKLRRIALNISTEFVAIEEDLNELCTQSCTQCSEICCMRATVWYDLKDLLFIYLNTGMFPSSQISRDINGACSQLASSGCTVHRAARPFICTWYICASQKEHIKSHRAAPSLRSVEQIIKRIQSRRKELQDIFLSMTSS